MTFLYPWGNTQQLNLDWVLQKIKELEAGTSGNMALAEVANALISATYSSSQAYDMSNIVYHDGKLYRANQAIPAPGETWTPAHWDEILLGDTVSTLVQYMAALSNDQIANNSDVPGTHTSDALDNLKADIDNNKITIYPTYYGNSDLDSIVTHALDIYASASLQNKPFVFTVLHPAGGQTGYFGNSSVTCLCKFSSANYGYGLLLSDNNKFIAAFRRDTTVNYLYPIGDFQTDITNLRGAINDVEDDVTALQNKISSYSKNETITNKWEYAYGAISQNGTRLVVKVDLEKAIGNLTFTPTRVGLYLRDSDNNMILGNNYDATELITILEKYNDYALQIRFESADTFGRTTNSFVVGQVILSGMFVE